MSNIEWTQKTWNPTVGCSLVSEGCTNCYAMKMAWRLSHMPHGKPYYEDTVRKTKKGKAVWTGVVRLIEERLKEPSKWRKPAIVFVNSMSDLFHESLTIEQIQQVFEVMNAHPQHTFQVLTKRAERLEEVASQLKWTDNIWMGVSVESNKVAGRIEHLKATPAKVKFLSCEPLIGALDLSSYLDWYKKELDWVIVGGESGGKNARAIQVEWVRKIGFTCRLHGIPFFFKQWGEKRFNPNPKDPTLDRKNLMHAKGGCELDGVVYREMPVVSSTTPQAAQVK